ncbi:MAG: WYL domain-containing protein, partial [Paracoccaceae bacterium]
AGVGYTLTEDPALPPQMFTRLEVEALVLGLAEVRLAGDPALARAADAALAKITATLPERVQRQAIHAVQLTYRFEKRPRAPASLAMIREACWDERALDMTYSDREGVKTQRRVWPLSVVFLDRTLMLLAWCCLRQGFRRFHLASMSDITLTTESFRPRRVALLREFLAQLRANA